MEEPTELPQIPDTGEPRFCPECGTRVADLASSCLMCGADLEDEEAAEYEEGDAPFRIPWGGLIAGIVTAFVFVGLVGWLVRAQIIGYVTTPTPAVSPTASIPPSPSASPTATPLPTATFTPVPPRVHQVLTGETCSSVAGAYAIALDVLIALNPEKCGPQGIIRPGDLLLVPASTPTPGPTVTVGPGTPSPTPQCPMLHVVQAGETGLAIAEAYDVPFNLIQTANPQVNFEQLPVNQVLQIPCKEPAPTATPTPDPNATPTPIPKYAAPALLNPPEGASLSDSMVPLQWTAVNLLREDEFYAVRLRRLDGGNTVQSLYTKTTVVRLGGEYAPTEDDPNREYSWEVTVVRQVGTGSSGQPRYTAASHPSERRTFRWLFAVVDGTPSPPPP
jgi:LysM repeat protein